MEPLAPPPASRNPDTIYLFALCLFAGTVQLASRNEPGSVATLVPTWMAIAWAILLIVGALLVLTGALWPTATGPLIEVVGRCIFGPAALMYAVAIYAAAGTEPLTALLATAPFIGFSIACLARAGQIVHRLHTIRRQLEQQGRP